MTQKELHRLRRRDILQLLLAQSEETEQLRKQLAETQETLQATEANYEKLRKRLDHKDEQIHRLRDSLEEQRNHRRIELEEAGSIAEAALRLNGIFEAAQKAADQYLYNLQLSVEERMQPMTEEFLDDDEDEEVIVYTEGEAGQTQAESTPARENPEADSEQAKAWFEQEADEPTADPAWEREEADSPQAELQTDFQPEAAPEPSEPDPEQSEADPEQSEADPEQSELDPGQPEARPDAEADGEAPEDASRPKKKTFWNRMGIGRKAG